MLKGRKQEKARRASDKDGGLTPEERRQEGGLSRVSDGNVTLGKCKPHLSVLGRLVPRRGGLGIASFSSGTGRAHRVGGRASV